MASHCPLTALLCLAGALLTTGTPVNNDHGCPEGWSPFGTRCFKFFNTKATWTVAEKSCQSHGANLASIHSTEENTFIVALINQATGENRRTWIGAQDAIQEGQWMWSDGSVWDYLNWRTGEPNNHGGTSTSL
uniref:C-type lectin domain-containing protein n=1 Tax=Neogobius melanostomus TaxID=47308 RepID=A0A8C6SEX0_9GOBI